MSKALSNNEGRSWSRQTSGAPSKALSDNEGGSWSRQTPGAPSRAPEHDVLKVRHDIGRHDLRRHGRSEAIKISRSPD